MGYIFEADIERIMNTVRARTIGEADTITLRGVLASNIHPAIKAYFRAEVERHLLEERQLEIRSRKFSYAVPEVASLQHQMDLLLMLQYEFDQHEFETLLDQAVHFTFNFLCRPQFTLVEFLFENQRQQSVARIEQKLAYCVNYEYYSILLKRYFTERGLATVSYEEFKGLLARIDREVVERHSSVELANMTRAIMGFVETMQEQNAQAKKGTLPVNAAIVFYEDKNLTELKLRLEYERDHHHLTDIELSRLAGMIEEVRAISSGKQLDQVVPGIPAPEAARDEDQQISILVNRNNGEEDALPEVQESGSGSVVTNESDNVRNDDAARTEPIRAPSPEPPATDVPGLDSLLSASERKKILKAIFHRDEGECSTTLDLLNRAATWEEASLILDDLFLAKGVDPQSRVAILLTEKVFGRFHTETE